MKKAIPSFILSLIFSIIGAIAAYVFYAVFILVGAFTGQLYTAVTLLPIINIFSFGIAFIGSIFCLINRKIGGIILILASIISLACYIVIITSLKLYQFNVFLFMAPTIFILFAGIIAFKKRKKTK